MCPSVMKKMYYRTALKFVKNVSLNKITIYEYMNVITRAVYRS